MVSGHARTAKITGQRRQSAIDNPLLDFEQLEFVRAAIRSQLTDDALHRTGTSNQRCRNVLGDGFQKLASQQPCVRRLIDRDPIQAASAQYDLLIEQSADGQTDMNQA